MMLISMLAAQEQARSLPPPTLQLSYIRGKSSASGHTPSHTSGFTHQGMNLDVGRAPSHTTGFIHQGQKHMGRARTLGLPDALEGVEGAGVAALLARVLARGHQPRLHQ